METKVEFVKQDTETIAKTTTTTDVKVETYRFKDLLQNKVNLLNESDRLVQEKANAIVNYDKLIAENVERIKNLEEIIAQIS